MRPWIRAQNFTVGVGKSVVLKPQSPAMTAAACVGGLLVPGLGHLLLGRWIRGILLLASVLLMFVLGLAMHGALSSPPASGELVSFKTLNTFANVGVGLALCHHVAYGAGGRHPRLANSGLRLALSGGRRTAELPDRL